MNSDEVRDLFLKFFTERDHARIPGASLIPDNDPTLLFVNSGMAPLKPYFTGQEKPPSTNLCNVQPCLRTKDIDDVGDRHHLTFFEMLGSWSIGGYFKERAIELAYELLAEHFRFDQSRLYVTVFAGDTERNLAPDDESIVYWEKVGVPRSNIIALGAEDNFWGPAGDTGPCGPCTEVFYDFGESFGPAYVPGGEFDTTRRYIEVWNAGVFMQFNKRRDGSFDELPFTSVDTGAGLERLTMALNGLDSVYETDLLAPLVAQSHEMLGAERSKDGRHMLVADHVRAATFILGEGVAPSNEGRGYVPRRLIRKCMAVAQGAAAFDLASLAETSVEALGRHYPRLLERKDSILSMLRTEESDFGRALDRGIEQLETLLGSGKPVSGREAFHLFATYGLPFEITRDLAAERGVEVDEAGYRDEFGVHQEASRARKAGATGRLSPTDTLPDLPLPAPDHFAGYRTLSTESRVLALFRQGEEVPELAAGDEAEIILDTTPFYAEGGGQIGDSGTLRSGDGATFEVADTAKHGTGYHVHRGTLIEGTLKAGDVVTAQVDPERRLSTAANHSATHLLNAALREIVGADVRQAGSLVDPQRLRFDFTHARPLDADQVISIERLVNRWILEDHARDVQVLSSEEARRSGAIYLEDEDYGDNIRVVAFGGASMEFCGGTHVDRTSQIGIFRVVNEQSVASGVRRINAVTRGEALDVTLDQERTLTATASALKVNPADVAERVARLLEDAKGNRAKPAGPASIDVELSQAGAVKLALGVAPEGADLRAPATTEAAKHDAVVVLVGAAKGGKVRALVAVPGSLEGSLDARTVLDKLLAPHGGKGGGTPAVAQGGASTSASPAELLAAASDAVTAAQS